MHIQDIFSSIARAWRGNGEKIACQQEPLGSDEACETWGEFGEEHSFEEDDVVPFEPMVSPLPPEMDSLAQRAPTSLERVESERQERFLLEPGSPEYREIEDLFKYEMEHRHDKKMARKAQVHANGEN